MSPATATRAEDDASVVSAEIAAGHDGDAELVLRVRYQNGVIGCVVLDAGVGFELMRNCGVETIAALAGHSWRRLLEGR
jgi:hypothetical protein